MFLCQKTVERWGGRLPQARESSHPGMSFTSDGKVEHELDRRINAASAIMKTFYRTVVIKQNLYVYMPTFTGYSYEIQVMAERMRSQKQAAKMSFLHRVVG